MRGIFHPEVVPASLSLQTLSQCLGYTNCKAQVSLQLKFVNLRNLSKF